MYCYWPQLHNSCDQLTRAGPRAVLCSPTGKYTAGRTGIRRLTPGQQLYFGLTDLKKIKILIYRSVFFVVNFWHALCFIKTYGLKCLGKIMAYLMRLKCALLCLPGSLQFYCCWKAPQCESHQVISLAKSKYLRIFGIFFWQTLNRHYSLTIRAFDLIPKLRARPEYQLSSVT